ncbi:ABC transporter substrate-binding protein [Formosa sp. S-31]|uniref:ABC transporter substrate-binding protein n=1 Tax=Formosa sp. S-31 TaxID=2790949 RepID=UPI003EB8DC2B
MQSFTDQLKRSILLNRVPERIVSLVPSQTELLCDLGLEDKLVGVTKFCIHPEGIRTSAKVVGGTKQVNVEAVLALKPDIILCNKEENSKAGIEELDGIAPIHISDVYTFEDSLELITMYGALFSVLERAKQIIDDLVYQKQDFERFICDKPVKRVAYFIWKSPWMVAANQTFINYVLQLNKLENVYGNLERYPEVDLASVNKVSPDYILLSSEPFPFKTVHKTEMELHCPASKIILVDGEMFSWYGSRLLKAFAYFKSLRENQFHY